MVTFFKMKGLTASGHCLATTLFNTWRNIAISDFLCELAGARSSVAWSGQDDYYYGDYATLGAGDDAVIMISGKYVDRLS